MKETLASKFLSKKEANEPEIINQITIGQMRKQDMSKYVVVADSYYQMDLMTLVPFNKMNYVLCIVNMRNKLTDVEALRTKSADEVLKAFKKILDRKIIHPEPKLIFMDNGKEFDNKYFKDFLISKNIQFRFTRAGQHRQNAIVENTNRNYKRLLLLYLSSISIKNKKYKNDWISVLFDVRDEINKFNKERYPKKIEYFPTETNFKGNKPKFEIGQEVKHALDQPRFLFTEQKLHGDYFRPGDRRFSSYKMPIENIILDPVSNQIRYKLKNIYGTFLEKQLLA